MQAFLVMRSWLDGDQQRPGLPPDVRRIADPGEGFDINHLAHAAISNPDDDPLAHDRVRQEMGLRPGGLGLVMTKAFVDEVIYNEKRNEVVLVKYLD